jgi:hypothetical protein
MRQKLDCWIRLSFIGLKAKRQFAKTLDNPGSERFVSSGDVRRIVSRRLSFAVTGGNKNQAGDSCYQTS